MQPNILVFFLSILFVEFFVDALYYIEEVLLYFLFCNEKCVLPNIFPMSSIEMITWVLAFIILVGHITLVSLFGCKRYTLHSRD